MKARQVFPFLLLLMGMSQAASALCTPYPLRLLVKESDIIVVAEVQETRQWFEDSHGREVDLPSRAANREEGEAATVPWSSVLEEWGSAEGLEVCMERGMAVLSVSSVLKGEAPDLVTVRYEPWIVCCPPQPEYRQGRKVLAFLNKRKREDDYVTCCHGYGAKFVSDEELRVYEFRIRQMFDLLEVRNREERKAAVADWLVGCAEGPATRWEGLYDLSEGAKWDPHPKPRRFWRRKEPLFPGFHTLLTESHRQRLFAMLKVLEPKETMEIWNGDMLMTTLAACEENEELAALAERYGRTWPRHLRDDEDVSSELRRILSEFIGVYEAR